MCVPGGLVPFSFPASWPRGGGKQGVAGRSAPRVAPPGTGGVGATPSPTRPSAAIVPREVSPTFPRCCPLFWGEGRPGPEAPGRPPTSRPRSPGSLPRSATPAGGAHSPGKRAPTARAECGSAAGAPAAGKFGGLVAVIGGGRGPEEQPPSPRRSACLVVAAATPNLIPGDGFTKRNAWVVGVLCLKDGLGGTK